MNAHLARIGRMYAAWRVKRDLDGLHVAGVDDLRAQLDAGPLLIAANHVGWWDGMVGLALGHAIGAEVALVARAETLQANPWMATVGVLPLHGGLGLRASARRVHQFLDRPNRMVWFFPQGRQRPETVRPLGFQPGIAAFARATGLPVVPAALAYPFRELDVPAAALAFGRRTPAEPAALEAAVLDGLGAITRWADGAANPADLPFFPVLAARRTPQQAGVGARLLTQVTR